MCGIAAIVTTGSGVSHLETINALAGRIAHRGDQPVSVVAYPPHAALGSARLAIVDPRGGHQPLEAGALSIVFNGEIYNHNELRAQLRAEGVRFEGESDTEVLLKAYEAWGMTFIDRLEGMYAFVILDRAAERFVAARDPFGIKPLYFSRAHGASYFCSEIYPLVAAGCEGIRPVPPGGFVSDDRISDRVLYADPSPVALAEMSFSSAASQLKAELADSVSRHMPPGDMPVAVFCSGGIDSSVILFEAVDACHRHGWKPERKIHAYSVGTPSSEDPRFASALAAQLGVPFTRVDISIDEMVEQIPLAISTIESFEPNHIRAGTTSLAIARRVAQDGYKVALLGEGADELLGGYEEFPATLQVSTHAEVNALLSTFCRQLHRTQLRRVDRTTMAFALEARVPFIDRRVTGLIGRIPTEYKVCRTSIGKPVGKYILREAYRNFLPSSIVDRRKIPMGEGAGIGDNGPKGAFFEHCNAAISDAAFETLKTDFQQFALRNKEEAHYFALFHDRFGALAMAAERPRTNMIRTT